MSRHKMVFQVQIMIVYTMDKWSIQHCCNWISFLSKFGTVVSPSTYGTPDISSVKSHSARVVSVKLQRFWRSRVKISGKTLAADGSSSKRRKPEDNFSSDTLLAQALTESIGVCVCVHCNKHCNTGKKNSNIIQCDLCYSWAHTASEGISLLKSSNNFH